VTKAVKLQKDHTNIIKVVKGLRIGHFMMNRKEKKKSIDYL